MDEEACEDLAVKAFQLKLLRGRLDQGNERITTTYAIKRDFTEGDWLDLKNKVSDSFWLISLVLEKSPTEHIQYKGTEYSSLHFGCICSTRTRSRKRDKLKN